MLRNIWEDLKLIFKVILSIVLIYGGFWVLLLFCIYNHDTNNENKQVVDYDAYVQDTFNINLNENTQVIEEKKDDNDYITDETVETLPDNDYKPGKMNPFSDSEPSVEVIQ